VKRWLILVTSGLVALSSVMLVVLLFTETGLQWVWNRIEPRLPETVAAERVDGRVAGPVVLHRLRVENEAVEIELERLEVRWRLGLLLAGRLQLDGIDAAGLRLRVLETEADPGAEPGLLPDGLRFPVRIRIADLVLQGARIEFEEAALAFDAHRVELEAYAAGHRLRIDRLAAHGPELDLALQGEVEMSGDWPLRLAADWRLAHVQLPPAAGSTRLEGSLREELRLAQSLSAPLELRLDARVRQPLENPSGELSARFRHFHPSSFLAEAPAGRLDGELEL
jgi:translocation and assembly module TamB